MLPYSLTFDRLVFGITGANSFLTSSYGTTQRFSVAIYDGVRFNNYTAALANSGYRSLGSFPSRASMRMRVMIIPPDLSAYPFISECLGGLYELLYRKLAFRFDFMCHDLMEPRSF
ncbi:hypothetical protein PENFLA_c027G07313 [Penicillium flavigenum]|uniref:Uncharacterized protein n=1 Tax=Penicillium flavigenum TaxID=254877 RepID=A0A1V6SS34_9EURO|nr:hypothetical protein PENFLA_c027G07313 [Penicillium flavigenum]